MPDPRSTTQLPWGDPASDDSKFGKCIFEIAWLDSMLDLNLSGVLPVIPLNPSEDHPEARCALNFAKVETRILNCLDSDYVLR